MRTLSAAIVVMVAALSLTRIADAGDTFRAILTGAEVAPPVGPVETATTGRLRIHFNNRETAAEFALTVQDGVRITLASLHCAPAGVNGPVVILAGSVPGGLAVDGKWISDATFTRFNIINANTACGDTLSALAQSMQDGNVNVQVRSTNFPGGLIRGQIVQEIVQE